MKVFENHKKRIYDIYARYIEFVKSLCCEISIEINLQQFVHKNHEKEVEERWKSAHSFRSSFTIY